MSFGSISRREFMRRSSAATLAAWAMGAPTAHMLSGCSIGAKSRASADTVILLWMAGGMAHTETFDPKRYTAYEKGLESKKVLSTFPAIDTAVDNIKISAGLEN